jgi:hypothetical protein
MQPLSHLTVNRETEPNVELLRRLGWSVNAMAGSYCVAWRGQDEAVFQWHGNGWHCICGRGSPMEG